MVRKGKMKSNLLIGLALLGIVILLAVVILKPQGMSVAGTGAGSTGAVSGSTSTECKETSTTGILVQLQNVLNTTGSEIFDSTVYVLDNAGKIVATISDTSAPATATLLNCGQNYQLAVVSASGTNSIIKEIKQGSGSLESGVVKFRTTVSSQPFILGVEEHGALEFRMKDNNNDRFAYDTSDASNSEYELTGVTFTNGDNATAFAVGSGEYLDFTLLTKTTLDDRDFQDGYTYVSLEMTSKTIWEKPSLVVGSTVLYPVTSFNNQAEVEGLDSYEYVFKVENSFLRGNQDVKMNFFFDAKDGQNPTADIVIDFYTAGSYLKVDGTGLGFGAFKDDASNTAVFTKQTVTIDIS